MLYRSERNQRFSPESLESEISHSASILRNRKKISQLFNSNNGQPDHPSCMAKSAEFVLSDLAIQNEKDSNLQSFEKRTPIRIESLSNDTIDRYIF